MIRTFFFFFISMIVYTSNFGQNTVWIDGYTKKDGTYTPGHYRQTPNSTNHDNWSTMPLINPYTSEPGTRAKDYSSGAYNYGGGRTIYTGPNGGQYYYDSQGNKVYVPKR